MSELTRCNYCTLEDMRRQDKKHAYRIIAGEGEWAGWLVVQKRKKSGLTSPRYVGGWMKADAYFKEISKSCVC